MEGITLSPNGKRFAFSATEKNRSILHLDGVRQGDYSTFAEFAFSPDSKTVIWRGYRDYNQSNDTPDGSGVYVNGKQIDTPFRGGGSPPRSGSTNIVFSPDSSRWAVRGGVPKQGMAVLVNGVIQQPFEYIVGGTMAFSPDSKELVYAAGSFKKGGFSLIRNGKPGKSWNYIQPESVRFVNGGKSVAMIAFDGDKGQNQTEFGATFTGVPCLVLDDKIIERDVSTYEFSPSGEHVFAVSLAVPEMRRFQISTLLLDGKKTVDIKFRGEQKLNACFSADSRHSLAFVEGEGGRVSWMIRDGVATRLPGSFSVSKAQIDNAGNTVLWAYFADGLWKVNHAPPK